jgi:hypothetical protein
MGYHLRRMSRDIVANADEAPMVLAPAVAAE